MSCAEFVCVVYYSAYWTCSVLSVLFKMSFSCHSMSLHLGNEVFDVYKAPLQGDHNHLFIRQGTGLQGQAVFKTKLTFR